MLSKESFRRAGFQTEVDAVLVAATFDADPGQMIANSPST
jgi:hypothetical protein